MVMAGSLILSRSPASYVSACFIELIVTRVFQIVILFYIKLVTLSSFTFLLYVIATSMFRSFVLTGEVSLNPVYPVGQQKNIEFSHIKPCQYFQLQFQPPNSHLLQSYFLQTVSGICYIHSRSHSVTSVTCQHLFVLRNFQEWQETSRFQAIFAMLRLLRRLPFCVCVLSRWLMMIFEG